MDPRTHRVDQRGVLDSSPPTPVRRGLTGTGCLSGDHRWPRSETRKRPYVCRAVGVCFSHATTSLYKDHSPHWPPGVSCYAPVPCTALRPNMYRPVVEAFDRGWRGMPLRFPRRCPALFELCYRSSMRDGAPHPSSSATGRPAYRGTRMQLGYSLSNIALVLEVGRLVCLSVAAQRWT